MSARPLLASDSTTLPRDGRELASREIEDLASFCAPILESPAFRRLEHITFLGKLSPRYDETLTGAPDDGSRADHSRGVAHLALTLCRQWGLSPLARRYAVAWGLTHDIATWALSHTSEPAFESVLHIDAKEARRRIITGDSFRSKLSIRPALLRSGVDPETLLSIFDSRRTPSKADLALLWQLVHSPLTPDTLEGMARSGRTFGIRVPPPDEVGRVIWRADDQLRVSKASSGAEVEFWKSKAAIYESHINTRRAIAFESRWALKIRDGLRRLRRGRKKLDLHSSLGIEEEELLQEIAVRSKEGQRRLPFSTTLFFRYKPPLEYEIDHDHLQGLGPEVPLAALSLVLVKSERTRSAHARACGN